MTEPCPCACHTGGAYRPPCSLPGGCGSVHTRPTGPLCGEDHGTDENGAQREAEARTGHICSYHRNRLDMLTQDIHNLWLDLALILEAGSAPKMAVQPTRHTKGDSAPAPVNLDAIALRDHRNGPALHEGDVPAVLAIIASWVEYLADTRPITDVLPSSCMAQLDLLTRHHDWLAGSDAIADYIRELTELRTALKSALRDRARETRTGKCGQCAGTLLTDSTSGAVHCTGCRATWTTAQELARLATRKVRA